jgi:hypothetical protein
MAVGSSNGDALHNAMRRCTTPLPPRCHVPPSRTAVGEPIAASCVDTHALLTLCSIRSRSCIQSCLAGFERLLEALMEALMERGFHGTFL